MGEIFRWVRPKQELPFTGERFTSKTSGQIEIEHLHRYFLARELSRGKAVLDIASGEGYGASLIAQVASSVIGIDINADAVLHANKSYQNPRLNFICANVEAIPLPTASIDLVASFETIEHIHNQDAFVKEISRVLRPEGQFIISTPNRDVYSPPDSEANIYHIKELDFPEFKKLLDFHFEFVNFLTQRPMIGSVLLPERSAVTVGRPLTFESRGVDCFEGSEGLPRAVYMIALASAHPVSVPPASVYIETSGIGLRLAALTEVRALNERLEERLQEAQTEIERLSEVSRVARAENERLGVLYRAAQSENQRLEGLFQEACSENQRLEPLYQTAQSENRRLEVLFQEARAESERLELLFRAAQSESQRLEALFQTARAENERLEPLFQAAQAENRRLEALFQTVRAENERLEPLFQAAQAENRRLEALFQTARAENGRLEPLLQAAQSENQRLEALFQEARAENERLESLFQAAQPENRRLEALFQEARAENERLETLLKAAQSENRRLDALFQEACAENPRLETLVQQSRTENQELGALLSEARNEQHKLQSLVEQLTTQLADAKTALVRTSADLESARQSFGELSKKLRMIERSLAWQIFAPLRAVFRLLGRNA